MNPFAYAAPEKLEAAVDLLGATWGETEILAGGTDLVTCLKQGLTQPKTVVSLRNIASLRGIKSDRAGLRIGAATTLWDVLADASVKKHFPGIITAIQNIGSPQTQAVGTVGGDLCQRPRCWYYRNGFGLFGKAGDKSLVPEGDNRYHAVFGNEGPAYFVSASSLGPILIALGAKITAAGPNKSRRTIPAAEFFRTPRSENERETALRPNEIVTEIAIPTSGLRNNVYEVRQRYGFDWPYVAAAAAFSVQGGSARDVRIVLGHVAPTPWNANAAARALEGARIDAASAQRAGAS